MKFCDLRLSESLVRAVSGEGYVDATPIQAKAIPHVLEGKDVLGIAQTGTGKTAAFALPVLHRMMDRAQAGRPKVRCLVVAPTRELATQIADSFRVYGKHTGMRSFVIFGGVGQGAQVAALRRGIDILVATPGRLLDLMEQGYADLSGVEHLVLDEADRMFDMGFIHDIRKIVAKLPRERQTMLFSATMPGEIRRLAETVLRNPVTVQVAPVASTADRVEQCVYFVEKKNKPELLAHLVDNMPMSRAIVFTRTKHGADKVVRHLHVRGIRAEAIHGNKSQNARERALENFRSSRIPVLVATDIASRGIDIDAVTHVVNYDLTHEPETYVHRIGRTARAGASGMAVSFCDHEEREHLRGIERLIKRAIPVRDDQPRYAARPAAAEVEAPRQQEQHQRPQHPRQPQFGGVQRHHASSGRPHVRGKGNGGGQLQEAGSAQRRPVAAAVGGGVVRSGSARAFGGGSAGGGNRRRGRGGHQPGRRRAY